MLKALYIFTFLFIAGIAGYFSYYIVGMTDSINTSAPILPPENTKIGIVHANDKRINVEIADTPETRQRGLMYRGFLAENDGMYFIFDTEGNHTIWMKNTRISLDIAWIDAKGKIVHIESGVAPCVTLSCLVYASPVAAKYVLEVNAGWFSNNNVFVGSYTQLIK